MRGVRGRFAKASIEAFALAARSFRSLSETTSIGSAMGTMNFTRLTVSSRSPSFAFPPISITDATLTPPPPSLSEDEAAVTATSNSIG